MTTQTIPSTAQLPRTLEEFLTWESNDGVKYEWNDGELIKFTGMRKEQLYIYDVLLDLFLQKSCHKAGTLVAQQDVMLNGIQMRRPDVAYFTKQQVVATRNGKDEIPEFVIEIISSNDQIYQVEKKIIEYFKAGVKVVWNILSEEKVVYDYTSRQNVKICIENDICSAAPVLPDFELSVNALLGL